MYDYSDVHQRLKHNFHYFKGPARIRIKAMTLMRILNQITAGQTIERATESEGVRRQYFYFWIRRLIANDFNLTCLVGKSKRPHKSPNATPQKIIDLAIKIRKIDESGGHTIAGILRRDHNLYVAGSTLGKIFKQRQISSVYRYKKRNEHKKRYAFKNPLECVQTDSSWSNFNDNHGNQIYFFPVIDDCTRIATVHVCDSKSGDEAVKAMQKFIDTFGVPEQVQTDNGVEFTNRYTSRRKANREKDGTFALFEQFLFSKAINHHLIRVRTPEHNGKVERFNGTLKRYLQRRVKDGLSLTQFQHVVDQYVRWYNRTRPHWSLNGLTPHERFYGVRLAKTA